MPLYEVRYVLPLTDQQKDRLAVAITHAHANKFMAMRSFVNVRFIDASGWDSYVGGKQRRSNMILGQVRAGPSRTQDMWTALSTEINDAWTEIVTNDPSTKANENAGTDLELRAVFFIGELLGGMEAGMGMPAAGQDMKWLQHYWPEIKRRAAEGEWEMAENVKDAEDRGLLKLAGLD